MPKIICISDTHDHDLRDLDIPDGDILIHSGDATGSGTMNSIIAFNHQLGCLPHPIKIFTPGNHDWLFQTDQSLARTIMTNAKVLINESTVINGLQFYGSPATPWFFDWAFNYQRGSDIKRFWDAIPENTDILITHGPPYGILDEVRSKNVGCQDLLHRVLDIRPKLHVFGHIHASYGEYKGISTHFVNASICNESYYPVNKPIVINL